MTLDEPSAPRCATCRFAEHRDLSFYEGVPLVCTRIDGGNRDDYAALAPAFVFALDSADRCLVVSSNFGCMLHEAKP